MKIILLLLCLSSTAFAAKYGQPITKKNPISLKQAISSKMYNKEVLIKAKVAKVCKKKGCWMGLTASNNPEVRVTFFRYSFFVPAKLIGKEVLVQGKLKEHTMSVKEAKHYAEDDGKDPSKVTSKQKEYRMVATGVKLI